MNKSFGLAVLLAFLTLAHARAAEWRMDPAGSRLEFIATFEKTPAPGVFKEFDVRLRFDPQRPAGSSLDVIIQVASADMASSDINTAIAGIEWFDVAGHPRAEYHATDIRPVPTAPQSNRFVARGTLKLKGVQQPVELGFAWSAEAGGATMEGELIAKRREFGIGSGEWAQTDVIGPDVVVKFRVRLRKVD